MCSRYEHGTHAKLGWLQGRATADHTTLLLNCYTKLKDVNKLENFLHGSGAGPDQLQFDTETAVKVGRLITQKAICTLVLV